MFAWPWMDNLFIYLFVKKSDCRASLIQSCGRKWFVMLLNDDLPHRRFNKVSKSRDFFLFCFALRWGLFLNTPQKKEKWNGRDLIQRNERSLIPPESCCSEVRSVQTFYKRGNLFFFFFFLKAAPFLIYASLKQFCKFLHKWALTYTSPRTVSPQLCCNSTKPKTLFLFPSVDRFDAAQHKRSRLHNVLLQRKVLWVKNVGVTDIQKGFFFFFHWRAFRVIPVLFVLSDSTFLAAICCIFWGGGGHHKLQQLAAWNLQS